MVSNVLPSCKCRTCLMIKDGGDGTHFNVGDGNLFFVKVSHVLT